MVRSSAKHALLITGAGASHDLGRDGPMPLMDDWARHLRTVVDEGEEGLADAAGLRPAMSAEDFERAIGALLRWDETRELRDQFRGLAAPTPAQHHTWAREGKQREVDRMALILDAINRTLYRLFRADRIDDAKATRAYAELLAALNHPKRLTVVTTNYDSSAERALRRLGRRPETGFDRPPGGDGNSFDVAKLVERADLDTDRGLTPVLHIHGAVGWYERDGQVWEHPPTADYDPSLGHPVVLYPDPDKDPTSNENVAAIWTEFRAAVAAADYVVVVGHSLRDKPLTKVLREIRDKPMVVGVCPEPGRYEAPAEAERVRQLVGGNNVGVIPLRFGPPEVAKLDRLHTWAESTLRELG
jgi:SIR2-like domain